MNIPFSAYTADYQQLHRLMQGFVNADDELRYADADYDIGCLVDAHEIAAEAVVAQINHLRRTAGSL